MEKNVRYCVELPGFVGPFEHVYQELASKRQSLQSISLAWVVDGFLAYAHEWCEFDLDEASHFLVMAASLLQWKALLLLPKPSEEGREEAVDGQEDQQQHLEEYRQFQALAQMLAGLEVERQQGISREPLDPSMLGLPAPDPLAKVSIRDLVRAFDRVFILADEEVDELTPITREQWTVEDRMDWLQAQLSERGSWIPFGQVFSVRTSRVGLIVTFLALLELVKLGKINAVQNGPNDEIMLTWAV